MNRVASTPRVSAGRGADITNEKMIADTIDSGALIFNVPSPLSDHKLATQSRYVISAQQKIPFIRNRHGGSILS